MKKLIRKTLNTVAVPTELSTVTTINHHAEVAAEAVDLSPDNVERIWSAVETLYRSGTQPAIQLCLRRRGEIVLHRAIGHRAGNGPKDSRDTPKQLMDTSTPMCLFSSSKAVTALLIHMLCEETEVNLLDPVSYYLPEFAKHGKRNITIHQILSHRGGIPGLPANVPLDTLWDDEEIWRLLCEAKPISVDGNMLAYHAITGGFVLGRLVQKITGAGIQQYLQKKLREPLAMTNFTYGIPSGDCSGIALNYATGPKPVFPISWFVKRALGADIDTIESVSNDRFHKPA
ncbi:penicillin binding protein [Oleiphilus messinensis]|uniref:Penicillin binding protein n=1 Tax=Oleiphilus messinensis TaxID=141451 RepID=A0A1Y0I187_9GAMM|nr:serine hydrolase domain-containing protein [Oleiphilus messinensis]ARU54161.1 penicillin binding protein [Oleiphilus messinensis]